MYILKQLFFSISVNGGFRNLYLAASCLCKYSATIDLDVKEKLLNMTQESGTKLEMRAERKKANTIV